ncbi:MAG: hypothetical protein FWC03_07050 [Treponema sp.]|nr:hypothetical protein [Treponema sp.]
MGIAPIDLQTLFTQVDKVGKTQIAEKEGHVLQQAIHGAQLQRKTEEHIRQVSEAQNMGEGVEKINDHNKNNQKNADGKGKENEKEDNQDDTGENHPYVLRDPNLGRKIDISL